MSFDKTTRNELARFVSDARDLLTAEFTRQLQHEYGLDPETGTITELDKLTALDDSRLETASILRETMAYYLDGNVGDTKNRKAALTRILREQAFTVLNRLCALRLAEARDLILQAVGGGYQSQGFQLYDRLAGPALGETGEAYRTFLFSIFDELAVELPPLFDRFSPEGRLFPRQTALLALLDLINEPDLGTLWAEDETIGWIYQYFNSQEERKAMRAASSAPRNSRELAVRNQFFTPRYVVEFLTDNTLGRIWYEMTKGETELVDTCNYLVRRPTEIFLDEGREAPEVKTQDEDLSQEELLKQPVYIPHRPLKDPREIKMLDPACGSMHFGLYAFDLFERIYEEAWELEERLGTDALWRLADLEPLHETYPDKTAFTRDVPRLIIERNIHGVDIDPRAVQIAGLSLWLRAQKSWGMQGLPQQERPQIHKSNIVCAESMPGDQQMLDDFLATLDETRLETLLRESLHLPFYNRLRVTPAMAKALAALVSTVWNEMELAGEAGSLLKIEETLREAVSEARKASEEKSPLFQVLEYGLGKDAQTSLDFWDHAEQLVLAALQAYAEETTNGAGYQRRLFAGDATQGFAFIRLRQTLYDVVLMNPPFGEFSKMWKKSVQSIYQYSYNDILGAFVDSFLFLLKSNGLLGAITSRTCFYITSFSDWRTKVLLSNSALTVVADLGQGVMDDAMVEAAAYVLQRSQSRSSTPFFRIITSRQKEPVLYRIVQAHNESKYDDCLFLSFQKTFNLLADSPFVYWIQAKDLEKIVKLPVFEPKIGEVRQGLATGDDFRFVRTVWEVPPENTRAVQKNTYGKSQGNQTWAYHVKAGASQPWYSPITLKVNWLNNGKELKNFVDKNGKLRSRPQNLQYYFRPGFSWTLRAVRFIPYLIPSGCIPSVSRYMAFPRQGNELEAMIISASRVASAYLRFYGEFWQRPKYLVETLKSLPWPKFDREQQGYFINQILADIQRRRKAYQNFEPFHEFVLPVLIKDFSDKGHALAYDPSTLIGEEAERWVSEAYGFNKQSSRRIERDLNEAIAFKFGNDSGDSTDNDEGNSQEKDYVIDKSEYSTYETSISYVLGCSFGRWDICYATGEKILPELPDPFAPLPTCPPGMLQNTQNLPAELQDVPVDYPLRITWPGVLTNDKGHHEDIARRIREALLVIWGENAESIEAEACQILGVDSFRAYFQKPNLFFADHLKRYSKSRRQAPIYWPLSTVSGSYTLWLYYHRINDQILFTCVNDFVDPKLKQVAEDSARLRQKSARSSGEENQLERLVDFESELKDFRAELLRVAAFWKPNLNDGVQITAAPLWRLFKHRPWQKRLRTAWEKLETGEYDWAHLAYSIWPDRVSKKCKTDKSFAIAHDLEHLYQEAKTDKPPKRSVKKSGQAELNLDLSD
jgi:hypothetical protein